MKFIFDNRFHKIKNSITFTNETLKEMVEISSQFYINHLEKHMDDWLMLPFSRESRDFYPHVVCTVYLFIYASFDKCTLKLFFVCFMDIYFKYCRNFNIAFTYWLQSFFFLFVYSLDFGTLNNERELNMWFHTDYRKRYLSQQIQQKFTFSILIIYVL